MVKDFGTINRVNTKVSYFTDWVNDRVQKFKSDSSNEASEEDNSSRGEEEEGEDYAVS